MKYFILIGNFKPGRPEGPAFKAALDAHHAYNQTFLDRGDILTCGPKPGGGGVCILRAESREAVEEYDYPVCFDFPAGHIGTDNVAIVMGHRIRLEVDGGGEVLFIP